MSRRPKATAQIFYLLRLFSGNIGAVLDDDSHGSLGNFAGLLPGHACAGQTVEGHGGELLNQDGVDLGSAHVSGDSSFDIEENADEGDYSAAKYNNAESTNQSAIRLMSLMVGGGVAAAEEMALQRETDTVRAEILQDGEKIREDGDNTPPKQVCLTNSRRQATAFFIHSVPLWSAGLFFVAVSY